MARSLSWPVISLEAQRQEHLRHVPTRLLEKFQSGIDKQFLVQPRHWISH
jgi:hypothetical protein